MLEILAAIPFLLVVAGLVAFVVAVHDYRQRQRDRLDRELQVIVSAYRSRGAEDCQ